MISTHLIHWKRSLLLGAIVAGLALPSIGMAGNGDPIRDSLVDGGLVPGSTAVNTSTASGWFERYVRVHPYGQGTNTVTSDWFERYAGAHPHGLGTIGATAPPAPMQGSLGDRGLPTTTAVGTGTAQADWFERYAAAHPYGDSSGLRVPDGFDWSDAGVGAGFATGLLTLVAASLFAIRRYASHRIQVL